MSLVEPVSLFKIGLLSFFNDEFLILEVYLIDSHIHLNLHSLTLVDTSFLQSFVVSYCASSRMRMTFMSRRLPLHLSPFIKQKLKLLVTIQRRNMYSGKLSSDMLVIKVLLT